MAEEEQLNILERLHKDGKLPFVFVVAILAFALYYINATQASTQINTSPFTLNAIGSTFSSNSTAVAYAIQISSAGGQGVCNSPIPINTIKKPFKCQIPGSNFTYTLFFNFFNKSTLQPIGQSELTLRTANATTQNPDTKYVNLFFGIAILYGLYMIFRKAEAPAPINTLWDIFIDILKDGVIQRGLDADDPIGLQFYNRQIHSGQFRHDKRGPHLAFAIYSLTGKEIPFIYNTKAKEKGEVPLEFSDLTGRTGWEAVKTRLAGLERHDAERQTSSFFSKLFGLKKGKQSALTNMMIKRAEQTGDNDENTK